MNLYLVFYSLSHALITVKLHPYGVDHDSFKLIRSCFSDQHQSMKLDSVFNSWFQIDAGVPQDSIFGSVAGVDAGILERRGVED